MTRIIKYTLLDILRNRIVLLYSIVLAVISFSMFNLESSPGKGLLSMLNIVLLFVPLVSMIFSTIYYYNSSEFIELLLAQPIRRSSLFFSMYSGLSVSLALAFVLGCGIPVLIFDGTATGLLLVAVGVLLTFVFSALAFLASAFTRDKARGIGFTILLWFYFAIIYDGLVLFILYAFSDYPLEKATLVMCALNPIDLARISVLLELDMSAMMGYTGALFQQIFGSATGLSFSIFVLLLWAAIPVWIAGRKFGKKDL